MDKTNRDNLFHKLIFLLTVFGMLTTVHLYIMNDRGFDQGCFGFETNAQVEDTFDCESVLEEGLTILGMSNIFWGFLHYSILMFASLLPVLFSFKSKKLMIKGRNFLIVFGFVYSAYLAYLQHFELNEYCALCLISGLISFILFLLLFISKFHISHTIPNNKLRSIFLNILFGGLIIAGTDYYYFNNLDIKTKVISKKINDKSESKSDSIECGYNKDKPFVKNVEHLITDVDIKYGNPNSKNILIELFDPNCTHCKKLHEEMNNIIEEYKEDIFIVIKPNPLWNYSLQQIQALFIANDYGLFEEMLSEQFKRQTPRKGLKLNQLKEIADIIGLDSKILLSRIKKNDFFNHINQENQKARKAGIKSAPTLILNGKTIASKSRNVECIGELIK
ncbi:MAG: vitamin K epoxide reductase family protein [Candidatus Marinimicrobia bacterium]|nr:vitamin K epoxide reductase family protein [Candidatus Neomarinimicrobiota bacterium]